MSVQIAGGSPPDRWWVSAHADQVIAVLEAYCTSAENVPASWVGATGDELRSKLGLDDGDIVLTDLIASLGKLSEREPQSRAEAEGDIVPVPESQPEAENASDTVSTPEPEA